MIPFKRERSKYLVTDVTCQSFYHEAEAHKKNPAAAPKEKTRDS